MTPAQRELIKEKLLEHDNEKLFNILKLDFDKIFNEAIDKLSDNELLEIFLENN